MLDEVLVTGRRVKDPTAQSTLIRTEPYADRQVSTPELLQSSSGVRVNRFGGLGSFSTISIRGSTSEQVQIYLDGVPLDLLEGGGMDLSLVPVELIESIEVFRGQTPAEFGSSGIGGLIDIRTRPPEGAFFTRVKAGGGSWETASGSGLHTGRVGAFRYLVGADVRRSRGNFDYEDSNGTPNNLADDERARRTNNDFLSGGGILRGEYVLTDRGRIDWGAGLFEKEQGVPGLGSYRSQRARLRWSVRTVRAGFERPDLGRAGSDLRVAAFGLESRQAFEDPLGEIGIGSQDNADTTLGAGGNLWLAAPLGRRQRWGGFVEYRHDAFRPRDDLFGGALTAGDRERVVATLQDEILAMDRVLTLVPSGRYEATLDRARTVDPRGGSTVELLDPRSTSRATARFGSRLRFTPKTSAQANVGRYFRYPDFVELYGDRGFIRGNPALDPEAGLNADAAFLYETQNAGALDHARLMTGTFYSRVADLIQFVQNSQATAVAQNFDRVRVIGLEAEATAAVLHRAEASLAYTLQEARDDSDVAAWRGKRVPGRPLHELFARAALFGANGKIFYEAQFTEGNFLDRANFLLLPSRWLHGAGLTARFLTRWSATVEAKNITNNQAEDYFGFPLPGRSYFGTLTATL